MRYGIQNTTIYRLPMRGLPPCVRGVLRVALLGLLAFWLSTSTNLVLGQGLDGAEQTIRLQGLPEDEIPVVTSIAIHPTRDLLATAGDDHWVRLWDLQSGQIRRTLRGHEDWVTCVAFSQDGRRLLTGGRDRRIISWDLVGEGVPRVIGSHGQPITEIALHPTLDLLAVASFRAPLRIYDSATGELLKELRCPCQDTRALSFSPDGSQLAAGGRNGKVRLWDLQSGDQFDLLGHHRRVSSVVFASDAILLSSGEEQRIHVWDIDQRSRRHSLTHDTGKVLCMSMLDPTRFAIATSKNVIALCDLRDAQPYRVLHGHTGSVAAIVARGDRLISGSFDTTVRIWKFNTIERESQAALKHHATALE